ncbi:MAG: hypothetical protein HKP58_10085 [Desulfatitalea sp.]|nr:hypothetical protein [Desulfatitalea sp.]NNK00750.1 hypothetical protein [Desulfatitalea sp.]
MKAEISRDSFDEDKTYSGVYQQQGRMLTDADWNEMVRILKHRMDKTVGAAIDSGSPRHEGILYEEPDDEEPDAAQDDPKGQPPADRRKAAPTAIKHVGVVAEPVGELQPGELIAFEAPPGLVFPGAHDPAPPDPGTPAPSEPRPYDPYEAFRDDPGFQWGRVYVDGMYAQIAPKDNAPGPKHPPSLSIAELILHQRDFPDFPIYRIEEDKDYVAYVDLWERLVITQEDSDLKDSALHGADTCVRTQTMAQIKLCLKDGTDKALEATLANNTMGNATISARKIGPAAAADRCGNVTALPSQDNCNALFRLEVHEVNEKEKGSLTVTLKWSKENGAVLLAEDFMNDPNFDAGHAYEIFTLTSEKHLGYHNLNGKVAQTTGEMWTQKTGEFKTYDQLKDSNRSLDKETFIRRWDGCAQIKWVSGRSWRMESQVRSAQVENNRFILNLRAGTAPVQVKLDLNGKRFLPGDYWLVLFRDTGSDPEVKPLSEEPAGIRHHYLVLGTVKKKKLIVPKKNMNLSISLPGMGEFPPLWTIAFTLTKPQWRQLSFPSLTKLTLDRVYYKPKGEDPPTIEETLHDHRDEIDELKDTKVDRAGDTIHGDLIVEGRIVANDLAVKGPIQRMELLMPSGETRIIMPGDHVCADDFAGIRLIANSGVDLSDIATDRMIMEVELPWPQSASEIDAWGTNLLIGHQPVRLAGRSELFIESVVWRPIMSVQHWLRHKIQLKRKELEWFFEDTDSVGWSTGASGELIYAGSDQQKAAALAVNSYTSGAQKLSMKGSWICPEGQDVQARFGFIVNFRDVNNYTSIECIPKIEYGTSQFGATGLYSSDFELKINKKIQGVSHVRKKTEKTDVFHYTCRPAEPGKMKEWGFTMNLSQNIFIVDWHMDSDSLAKVSLCSDADMIDLDDGLQIGVFSFSPYRTKFNFCQAVPLELHPLILIPTEPSFDSHRGEKILTRIQMICEDLPAYAEQKKPHQCGFSTWFWITLPHQYTYSSGSDSEFAGIGAELIL